MRAPGLEHWCAGNTTADLTIPTTSWFAIFCFVIDYIDYDFFRQLCFSSSIFTPNFIDIWKYGFRLENNNFFKQAEKGVVQVAQSSNLQS